MISCNKFFSTLLFSFSITIAFSQLYTNRSSLLPSNSSGQSMDVKAVDIDQDGDLDLLLANEFQRNQMLLNNGHGQFANSNVFPSIINDSEDVIVIDANKDGNMDVIFCSEDNVNLGHIDVHEFYLGDSNGGFTNAVYRFPDSEANAVISADIDNDGNEDVIFGNDGPIGVFMGNGDGSFDDVSSNFPISNKTTQDLLAIDIDGDNDLDIFEANENGNLIYINNANGFEIGESDRLPLLNVETRKISAGDIDNDGDLDLFLSNVEFIVGRDRQNRLLLNDGNGFFTDITLESLPIDNDHTIDGIFVDVDFDGDLDLIVANVFGGNMKCLLNDGMGSYTDKSFEIFDSLYVFDALGVIAEDLNGDGLRDLYFCDRNQGNAVKDLMLFRNKLSNVNNVDDIEVVLFPNPIHDKINIKLKTAMDVELSLIASNGITMYSELFYKTQQITWDLPNNISTGLYYCRINAHDINISRPIYIK